MKIRNSFAWAKVTTIMVGTILAMTMLCGCSSTGALNGGQGLSAAEASAKLNTASKITLKKDMVNFGDHWQVYAGDEKVADINGELIKIWDCYVMRSTNGEFMCAEQEQFALITSRAAKVDENGNEIGRIDQNISLLFLRMTSQDTEGNTVATLNQNLGLTLDCTVTDTDGTSAWHVSKSFISFGAELTVTREEAANKVPAEEAILMAAIANELDEAASDDD